MPAPERFPGRRPARRSGTPPGGPASGPGSRRAVPAFLLRFGLLLGAYYLLVMLPWGEQALYAYLRANAWLANGLLQALGQGTRLSEVTIRAADFAISVRRGCDAVEPAWFFCAAVLAFPLPWRRKPVALLAGAGLLLAVNLVRIVSLFLIGRHLSAFFPTAHLELWPAAFILLAVGLWLAWVRAATARMDAA